MHSFHPAFNEDPLDLEANDHNLVEDHGRMSFVRKDARMMLLRASQIADVYVWILMRLCNLEEKLKTCLPVVTKHPRGWLGQECCEVASFNFPGGKPNFFKT